MRSSARLLARTGSVLAAMMILSACQSELYTGLPEQEANEMIALLLHDGLGAAKIKGKDGSDTILIDQKQFASAVDLLQAHGLPRARFSSINDVFQPSGLIASPMQEQARYLWALGQELSKTVSQIDGVLTARVQVVLPDNDLMKRESTPSSASVFIRYDEASLVSGLVSQIKSLVANSVQGLTYDKVSVVMVPVAAHPDPPPSLTPATAFDWEDPTILSIAGAAVFLVVLFGYRNTIRRLLPSSRPGAPAAAE